ncbi:MAG: hypothetical protein M1820_000818 [Bogoriella megaspora]|nr:MAG: hypothetical protein M1820_000818 [Bogoriella megaspora]
MASTQYSRVQTIADDDNLTLTHRKASTSSGSSPDVGKLTPDPDSDDDTDDDLEAGQSFKMKELHSPIQNSTDREEDKYSGSEKDDDDEGGSPRRYGRRRRESAQSFELYTPDEEKAVVRKLDRRLVLFMALLYMLSFLDRSNIGNARIAGMVRDLRLNGSQYEWLLSGFYITYIVFEWMALLYRVVPPHIYISICVMSWGILASLQSITTNFSTLLVIRALLGIGEAAFGPGVPFYLSFFYKGNELAFRTGLFISAAPLATSFASSLAWVITKIGRASPVAAWRLLFLVEGFPSVIAAIFAFTNVPDNPKTARFLSSRQRKVAKLRLRNEGSVGDASRSDDAVQQPAKRRLDLGEVLQTLTDPKSYLTALMFFSCNVAFSSMPVFLPTIIKEMGYSSISSQALSAPPYLCAFLTVLITAYFSDQTSNRSFFIALHALLSASGYCLIAATGSSRWSPTWRYIGIYPAAAGFFSCVTIIITWTINNQESDSRKGTGIAMLNIIGQCGPLLGTRLYPNSDKPYYVKGMSICAAFMLVVCLLALALRVVLKRANRRGTEYAKVGHEGEGHTPLVDEFASEKSRKRFVYML